VSEAPLPPRLSPVDLQGILRSADVGVRLLDVRTAGEYLTCRIPTALNVPLDQLPRYRDEISSCPDVVVLVCQQGPRAEQAQRLLNEAGHRRAHVLEGGMVAWQQVAGEVEQGEPRWALERQVRLVAGSIVLTGILGSMRVPQLKWLSGAIGAGLTFAALSNTCLMGTLLGKLPYNRGSRRDVELAVSALAA
jgi:rhodanese-related sulfurtransferase